MPDVDGTEKAIHPREDEAETVDPATAARVEGEGRGPAARKIEGGARTTWQRERPRPRQAGDFAGAADIVDGVGL